jgi:hypothetical protein
MQDINNGRLAMHTHTHTHTHMHGKSTHTHIHTRTGNQQRPPSHGCHCCIRRTGIRRQHIYTIYTCIQTYFYTYVQEINNGRLAMVAIAVFAGQEFFGNSAVVNMFPQFFTAGPLANIGYVHVPCPRHAYLDIYIHAYIHVFRSSSQLDLWQTSGIYMYPTLHMHT